MMVRQVRGRLWALGLAILLLGEAHATVRMVDDDGADCPSALYTTVGAAVDAAIPGDEVVVCAGTYAEQIVIDKKIRLQGQPSGSRAALIRPTALSESRPSLLGGRAIRAGIVVEARTAAIDSIDLDMSASDVTTCDELLAGVYFRNAGGLVNTVSVAGVRVGGLPACESGVGLYVESGQIGERFGEVILGKAKLLVTNSRFVDWQKGGVVANGAQTVLNMAGGEVVGSGLTAGAVQNGIQLGMGARGKVSAVVVRNVLSSIAGKTAAGVLLFRSGRVTLRRGAISDVQTGVLVVGRGRVVGNDINNASDDGIVLLGSGSLVSANTIIGAGVSGIFMIGDRNRIRFGTLSSMPIGLWFYGGEGNTAQNLRFHEVDLQRVGAFGGPRDLTEASAAPLLAACRSGSDCDDAITCTIDTCDPGSGLCMHVSTCNDANACTDDICGPTGCVHTPNNTPCDDGNACTVMDACGGGSCRSGGPIVCNDGDACTFDACSPALGCVHLPACNDRNPCTADACQPATGCSNTPVADGTSCADPNPCNGAEVCAAGVCAPATPLDCDDNNVCTIELCDPAVGCRYTPVAAGAPCPDASVCNGLETCQGSTCQAGTPLGCDDGNACTTDSCNAQSGCVHAPIAGCVTCTDSADCNDSNPCTADVCSQGACQNGPVADGAPCPDGNACNGSETCQAGACQPGTPVDCDDNNPCTLEVCDPLTGCQHLPVLDGTPCADATLCNGAETCQAGLCQPGAPLDCNDGNPCTGDSCLPVSGCQQSPSPDGTPCSDGDACNGAETCQSATCVSGSPPDCSDTNPCTLDLCDPASGCIHPGVPNGTACGDSDVCNGIEACQSGSCVTGAAPNCDDGNACTIDDCNPLTGCAHTQIPGCQPCSGPGNCNDSDPCTADVCSGGICQYNAVPNGQACSDGDACNGTETCQAGVCVGGTAPDCDDANVCTVDTCVPATGCQNTPVQNGTSCADSTVCNGAETCQNGTCQAGPPLNCNDGNVCTLDACHVVSGCQYTPRPDGTSCADSTVCNGAERCQGGLCIPGTPLDCNDQNPCTADVCSPLAGCLHTPISPCP
jgi:hypothetical protein